jgi:hypothetical protein
MNESKAKCLGCRCKAICVDEKVKFKSLLVASKRDSYNETALQSIQNAAHLLTEPEAIYVNSQWNDFPYDMHRIVLEFIDNGNDLMHYLKAFKYCSNIGDLSLILKVHEFANISSTNLWPVLRFFKSNSGMEGAIEAVAKASHLFKEIELSGIEDINLVVRSSRPKITWDLRHINIDSNWIKKAHCHLSTRVSKVLLYGSKLNDECIQVLTLTLPNSKIQELNIYRNNFTTAGCISLTNVLHLCSLKKLEISDNSIGDEGITAISKVLPATQIQELYLRRNRITSLGCFELSIILEDCKLKILDISNNSIGDEGMNLLASVLPNTQIHKFMASSNAISYESCEFLSRILKFTQISILDLSWNHIGNKGCNFLSKSFQNSKLQDLNLNNCMINDEGLLLLIKSIEASNLKILNIAHNNLTFIGFVNCCSYLKSSQLDKLVLTDSGKMMSAIQMFSTENLNKFI